MSEPARATTAPERQSEFDRHLEEIADWWLAYARDENNGGFHGQVNADNRPEPDADKGVVLNTRILWFFSELAGAVDRPEYRQAAERAYEYLCAHFIDAEYGGVYWALDARGRPVDDKKQVYAQAFAIYALSAYHRLSGEPRALERAMALFDLLERHAVCRDSGGYLEAFGRRWESLQDVRLSEQDLNHPKTMNTHLHVLEAYTDLNKQAGSARVSEALAYTIDIFQHRIIDTNTHHLRMFMGLDWRDHSAGLSYGHDIECSWLLTKALTSLGDEARRRALTPVALKMVDACLNEAVGPEGELFDAFDFAQQRYHTERVWWVQAEALVGYLNAYTLTRQTHYWQAAEAVWAFIKNHQLAEDGEWRWLSDRDSGWRDHYKAGFWKGPYHNGRAMLEARRCLQMDPLPGSE